MNRNASMKWSRLLDWQRLGRNELEDIEPGRPPWQVDFDRITFSSAFRRLQDKTQVFPLSGSDYVRTRLTHSLEVSAVGRTLGMRIGAHVLDGPAGSDLIVPQPQKAPTIEKSLRECITPHDFGTIVATAALAHDLGNPPFGHSGEDAVRNWFVHSPSGRRASEQLTERQRQDLTNWEGNAQGFRILTRLQIYRNRGGMQLTHATLAAFTKYPAPTALKPANAKQTHSKKNGFFAAEADFFERVANETGLLPKQDQQWCRHPLAYLMEAADDLCYRVIDFEDGYRLGRIPYHELEACLLDIVKDPAKALRKLEAEPDDSCRVSYLRASAINSLIQQCVDAYFANESQIMAGDYVTPLVEQTPAAAKGGPLEKIQSLTKQRVYTVDSVLETEAAGFEIIGGLLDLFWNASCDAAAFNERHMGTPQSDRPKFRQVHPKSEKILQKLPIEFLAPDGQVHQAPYQRLLSVTDFVTGMTDSYALSLYRRLKGIALPS